MVFEGQRRIGRPRMTWANVMAAYALQVAGGSQAVLQIILSNTDAVKAWKIAVKQHF